ncbi:hypothetical protein [Blastococcus sp. TF02A-30]|uniref:hypothetical protein n=1 Tax=Blastococcus sp. TF02A-30 TaxID=2250580 RepID=UPI000DE86302|nr:hypothetical protein [Blastococcus sp. TF02A-30]RBY92562.1 hypothetical protein DQ241_00225 [Blastococcus sp. TF02A-30]
MAVLNLSGRRSRREKWLGDPESRSEKRSRWIVAYAAALPPLAAFVVAACSRFDTSSLRPGPYLLELSAGAFFAVACVLPRSWARAVVVAVVAGGLVTLGVTSIDEDLATPGQLWLPGVFVLAAVIICLHDVVATVAAAGREPTGRAVFRGRGDEVLAAEGCTVCDRVVCARPTPDEIDELGPLVPPVEPGRRWPAVAAVAVVALASGALLARRRG